MTKIVTITMEINMDHPEKKRWRLANHFYLNELDETLDEIRNSGGKKYKNSSGRSPSKATKYKVSVTTKKMS